MSPNDRTDLPIPDYDHLPVGDVAHRVHALDAAGIEALLSYEREHGARQPVITVLENRRTQLEQGAKPSTGSADAPSAAAPPPPQGQSPVSPATEGPVINPPSQGVPTNPAQPRSTG